MSRAGRELAGPRIFDIEIEKERKATLPITSLQPIPGEEMSRAICAHELSSRLPDVSAEFWMVNVYHGLLAWRREHIASGLAPLPAQTRLWVLSLVVSASNPRRDTTVVALETIPISYYNSVTLCCLV